MRNNHRPNILNFRFSKSAFTIVELIIAIVILFILAAIMIPVILGVQQKANRAVDIASAKTLYMAGAVMLANDFEIMPDSVSVDSASYNDVDNKSSYLESVREYLGTWPATQTSKTDQFFLQVSKDTESIEVWLGEGIGNGLKFNNVDGRFDWPD